YISLSYATLVCGNCLNFIIIPIVSATWTPPLYAWYPCNMSISICYWSCYLHQSTGFLTIGAVHVACETLVTGFILQICAQLEVLNHRVLSINLKIQNLALREKDKNKIFLYESFLTNACITDHNSILKFAELLSETFLQVLFIQFCASLSVIGTSIYLLTTIKVYSADFVITTLYLICLLNQMLLYCWYSNQVLLNSRELFRSIYNTDWITLHSKTQKTLLLMMLMASSPIQLFKGAIIKVNLDAFLNVLKFSYSAFNILKNPSKDLN
ncbi:hypothetical protein TSAR_012329, partial [Trichomalopsis sarcophagae]